MPTRSSKLKSIFPEEYPGDLAVMFCGYHLDRHKPRRCRDRIRIWCHPWIRPLLTWSRLLVWRCCNIWIRMCERGLCAHILEQCYWMFKSPSCTTYVAALGSSGFSLTSLMIMVFFSLSTVSCCFTFPLCCHTHVQGCTCCGPVWVNTCMMEHTSMALCRTVRSQHTQFRTRHLSAARCVCLQLYRPYISQNGRVWSSASVFKSK